MTRIEAISIILFPLFVSSCSDKEDKLDCINIKKGKFEYRGGLTKKHYSVERTDSIQIERDEDTGLGMKFKIEWKGECDYIHTPLSFIINGKDSIIERSGPPLIKARILKVTRNYYICRPSIEGENIVHRDTMLIIK